MRIWSFISVDPTTPWASARVASWDRLTAANHLAKFVDAPLVIGPVRETKMICQILGDGFSVDEGVLELVPRVSQ